MSACARGRNTCPPRLDVGVGFNLLTGLAFEYTFKIHVVSALSTLCSFEILAKMLELLDRSDSGARDGRSASSWGTLPTAAAAVFIEFIVFIYSATWSIIAFPPFESAGHSCAPFPPTPPPKKPVDTSAQPPAPFPRVR